MPRSELAGLFEMLRAAPVGATIAEMRSNLNLFVPFTNANAPEVVCVLEERHHRALAGGGH